MDQWFHVRPFVNRELTSTTGHGIVHSSGHGSNVLFDRRFPFGNQNPIYMKQRGQPKRNIPERIEKDRNLSYNHGNKRGSVPWDSAPVQWQQCGCRKIWVRFRTMEPWFPPAAGSFACFFGEFVV